MLTEEAKSEIDVLFPSGLTASHAYSDFVRMSLGHKSEDDLQFYINKSDRSKCPKGNSIFLYAKYCMDQFGGRNGIEMFDKMEERIEKFLRINVPNNKFFTCTSCKNADSN